jgi:heme exporter protein B
MLTRNLFFRQIGAILIKDLQTEWRTLELFTSMFIFAVLVIVVFNFALGSNTELIRPLVPGILWITLLFATILGLQRATQKEGEEDTLQGVILALHDYSALFIAKMLVHMLHLSILVLCTLPLCSLWFHIDFTSCLASLTLILFLGILGLSIIGTLFAMIMLNVRTREVMLPLLFLPISVPITIAAVHATTKVLDGKVFADVSDYIISIGVFDIVFFVVSLIVFDYIIEE